MISKLVEYIYTNDFEVFITGPDVVAAKVPNGDMSDDDVTFSQVLHAFQSLSDSETMEQVTRTFTRFIRLVDAYLIADKFGLPKLRSRSMDGLREHDFQSFYVHTDFATVVERVLESTTAGCELRLFTVKTCINVSHMIDESIRDRWNVAKIVTNHEPMAWAVGSREHTVNSAHCVDDWEVRGRKASS
ncbi:uncharacterized protein AB675_6957 [Cyphellophora attinorum]|uniref:Uncharacterized protein n=1 Tax=Cyphellophora attinorum TaxID=1664694 RepID=A0A0N0NPY9_9EURO|nr:uncharacterized protein AB675_6957 [Phialophora attinorum]KPI43311.1 hypothetical protein AB675_6957 [Phialophora attinorum]